MSNYKFKNIPSSDAPVEMAVLTCKQLDRLRTLELCFDSFSRIASRDDHPEFIRELRQIADKSLL